MTDPGTPETRARDGRHSPGGQRPGEPPLAEGLVVGDFRLGRHLGKGGFAEVWEARRLSDDRQVALKVLRADAADDPELLDRFAQEGRIAASLSDPACAAVFGTVQLAGRPTIVLELMTGGTLQDRLDREGRLPWRTVVPLALDVLDGLDAAHAAGVVHRDLKPSNCFVGEDGRVRLGDFGISKSLERPQALTSEGAFIGTALYASPEQLRGIDVGVPSDLYSFGATIHALLVGRPPYLGSSPADSVARVLTEPPPSVRDAEPSIPRELDALVRSLLAKEPGARPPAARVREALERLDPRAIEPASLSARFAAWALDAALVVGITQVLRVLLLGGTANTWPGGGADSVLNMAVPLAWFAGFETVWGATPGKALAGLRVRDKLGGPATAGAILLRSLVFGAPLGIAHGLVLVTNAGDGTMLTWLAWPALALLRFATIRESNGRAGVHEIASGTRVVRFLHARRAAEGERAAPVSPGEGGIERVGPFVVVQASAASARGSWLEGWDPALRRRSWIVFSDRDVGAWWRAGRTTTLHLLQSGRVDGRTWRAYEAVPGRGLLAHAAAGATSWPAARSILLDTCDFLQGREHGGSDGTSVPPLEALWIDDRRRLRVLPFVPPGVTVVAAASSSAAELVRRVAKLVLGGGALPETGREALAAIDRAGGDDLADAAASLRRSTAGTAAPSGLQRLIPVALGGAVTAGFVALLLGGYFHAIAQPWGLDYVQLSDTFKVREGGALQPPVHRLAIERLAADMYRDRAAADWTSQTALGFDPETEYELAALARTHQPMTAAERSEARRVLGFSKSRALLARKGPLRAFAEAWPFVAAPAALLAILAALALRGPVLGHVTGLALQHPSGSRASRWRCAVRALTAWSPALLAVVVLSSVPEGEPEPSLPVALAGATLLIALPLVAFGRPRRSLPDLVAGTVLVRR